MSRKIWNSFIVFGLAVVAASAAGCGGVSSAQKADAGNVAGGLAGAFNNTSNPGLQAGSTSTALGDVSSTLHGVYWWSRFAAEAKALDVQNSALSGGGTSDLTFGSCPASTTTVTGPKTGASCTGSCNSAMTSVTEKCTLTDGSKESCNGVAYSFTGVSVSATVDLTNVTVSGAGASGTMGIGIGIAATITGGSLSSNVLSCTLNTSINLATPTAAPAIDCSSFTCTLDGKSISCDDMAKNMGATACTKTT